jgi:very-short-patch-repair endonuclease
VLYLSCVIILWIYLDIVKSYRIGLYELDFSIPDKRIDIEIDGDQHYYDEYHVNYE